MNSHKKRQEARNKAQRGNAMIYILIALALFGALTLTLSSQNEQSDSQNLTDEMVEFQATQLIKYALTAKNVVEQMLMTGVDVDDLSLANPTTAAYDAGSNYNKVFHPEGGGLNYEPRDPAIFTGTSTPTPGWYFSYYNNVEWTPSTADDVILTAYQISKPVCEAINKKITGSIAIPAITGSMSERLLGVANGAPLDADFTTASCAACEGAPSLCVSNGAVTAWSFYNIIVAQ